MGESDEFVVRVFPQISGISDTGWNNCANTDAARYNPFVCHAFLSALELSGCATAETGWQPQHLALENSSGELLACMPNYLKSNSFGEYIFDHGWAEAFENAGGNYYPKLQCAVPFTPVQGNRLLAAEGPHHDEYEQLLASAAIQLTDQLHASSLHITFLTRGEWDRLGDMGFLKRKAQQFHWQNRGYSTFDDFLQDLSSRKRKMIRRERRDALCNDIEIEWITGPDLKEEHWDHFFDFYEDTGSRKWGMPYLNREFFSLVGEMMADNILLVMCKRNGNFIGGALNFIGGDTLFGRYWGCREHHNFLHFETCYYQAIDFAIQNDLGFVEAGAQGPHKLSRGYLPQTMYSVHYIPNISFRNAVAEFLQREQYYLELEQNALHSLSPFSKAE